MATITIKNSPLEVKYDYEECYVIPKKSFKIGDIKEIFFNKEKNIYGYFEGKEVIQFLELLDYEKKNENLI